MVVLIPARGGSKRIPGKALKLLGGRALIDWTIGSTAVGTSGLSRGVVCSEDEKILAHAQASGALIWERPGFTATDDAPDLTWLALALRRFPDADTFVIRRPTSPFVSGRTLERAIADFQAVPEATSMRAMRPVSEHPMKMWERSGTWMAPIASDVIQQGIEVWSTPTQQLSQVYIQTAGLELIRRSTIEAGSLTGARVLPLFLEGPEALDLNTLGDWERAEAYVRSTC